MSTETIASSEGQEVEFGKPPATSAVSGFPTDIARSIVYTYVKAVLERTDTHVTFGLDEVYPVWFAFTLGNWKALLSTTLPDQMYYEVTYNHRKAEYYLDAYKKWENVTISAASLHG